MDPDKFARLSARLQRRTDWMERGQLLPLTEAALAEESHERLPALVAALAEERVIVPVPVEAHPDEKGEHLPINLGEDSLVPLATADFPGGLAIVAFTQASQLTAWNPSARPMPMEARRVALTAMATGIEKLWIDPADERAVVIPRPAVVALAHGDSWLPACRDAELLTQLRQIASAPEWVAGASVRVDPEEADGLVRVHVTVAPREPGRLERTQIAGLLADLAASPRLRVAVEKVEFVPQIAPLV